jgi:ectoine hydroxylase-related dioxygenase (phytanoyl-CoA dioxygenase family)
VPIEPAPPVLTSNGVPVPFDDEHFAPLDDSTSLLAQPSALRERYERDGYVFLRQAIDPERVLALRQAYFEDFDRTYFRPGTRPQEGVFSGRRPAGLGAHGVEGHPAHAFVRGPRFEAFAGDPALEALGEAVLGGPVWRLPRSIVRHFDRAAPVASRAHVDYSYLDAGTDRLATVWIPLGDCPVATGGLVYLEGTGPADAGAFAELRKITDRPHDARAISHDLAWVGEKLGRRWRWADYRAGDVTIHSPHIVHASLDTTTDTMRLSADVRFILRGDAVDARWLKAWAGDDGN